MVIEKTQKNPFAAMDQMATAGSALALVGVVTQKSASFVDESLLIEKWAGKKLPTLAGRVARSSLFAPMAPLAMATMVYNAGRAIGRLIDHTSEDRVGDWLLVGGALCGVVALMGSFNPLLRGVAALAGLTLDAIDLYQARSPRDLLLQAGLTLVFGLDRESRQALKTLLPTQYRFRNFKTPPVKVYSDPNLIPEGETDPRLVQTSHDLISYPFIEGVMDAREIRFIHSLSEGRASELVDEKAQAVRKILSRWKRKHPFTWKRYRKRIVDEMTRGDKNSKDDRIRVARYRNEGDFLAVNGHRRLATLHLLAAKGEIPFSWLREIPVCRHEIWYREDIGTITDDIVLKREEVLAEVTVGRRSPAEAVKPLEKLTRGKTQFEPWKLPAKLLTEQDEADLLHLKDLGLLDVTQEALGRYLIGQAKEFGSLGMTPHLAMRLGEDKTLHALVFEICGEDSRALAPFLLPISHSDPERVIPHMANLFSVRTPAETLYQVLIPSPIFDDPRLHPALRRLFVHPDFKVRSQVAEILLHIPYPSRFSLLQEMLDCERDAMCRRKILGNIVASIHRVGQKISESGYSQGYGDVSLWKGLVALVTPNEELLPIARIAREVLQAVERNT